MRTYALRQGFVRDWGKWMTPSADRSGYIRAQNQRTRDRGLG